MSRWKGDAARFACRMSVPILVAGGRLPGSIRSFLIDSLDAMASGDRGARALGLSARGRPSKTPFDRVAFFQERLAEDDGVNYATTDDEVVIFTVNEPGNVFETRADDVLLLIAVHGHRQARYACSFIAAHLRAAVPMPHSFHRHLVGALVKIANGVDPDEALLTSRPRGRETDPVRDACRTRLFETLHDASRGSAAATERAVSLIEITMHETDGGEKTVRRTTKRIRQVVRKVSGTGPRPPGRPKKKPSI